MQYELLDSGEGEKLERTAGFVLVRPDPQAIWRKALPDEEWQKADAIFEKGWKKRGKMPEAWQVEVGGYKFRVSLKNFKHTGVFPEQIENWHWISEKLKAKNEKYKILNLFGYTGGATVVTANAGGDVTHVDASKPAITAAKENARLNGLEGVAIRWIVDDVRKFVAREIRRRAQYDGVVMDPPVFGRGAEGEVWKIEKDLMPLLQDVQKILKPDFKFILLNGYASGYASLAYAELLASVFDLDIKDVEHGELDIKENSSRGFVLPAGIFARYTK